MNIDEFIEDINSYVGGWCTPDKQEWLIKTILERKLEKVIEIGVWEGKSLLPMAKACQIQGFGSVIAIDAYKVSKMLENGGDEHPSYYAADQRSNEKAFKNWIVRSGLSDYVEYDGPKESLVAAEEYEPDTFDMIHIDANHSEVNTLQDFYTWYPLLKKGGVLVLDDTNRTSTIKLKEQATALCSKILIDSGQWMALEK
jgi:SAM-dependent methyltransferase